MWLESKVGVGTTILFSVPLPLSLVDGIEKDDVGRWFSPYSEYQPRERRSSAVPPVVTPRYVILDESEMLQRLFSRYLHEAEVVRTGSFEEAVSELSRSPSQALVMNIPLMAGQISELKQLSSLPYGTPAVFCRVPGEDETARRLGVACYLVKPLTRDVLLSTLDRLGNDVRCVLLVDDQPEALQLFSRILASAEPEYDILLARSGRRALSLLRRRRPDIMLLDLIMPDMDGFQVLQEKAQDPVIRDIPVIIISSRDPMGEPIVSDTLTIARSGGLSMRDVIDCVEAIGEVLSPLHLTGRRERPERTDA
jgi:CheY-like chemotaxis protein